VLPQELCKDCSATGIDGSPGSDRQNGLSLPIGRQPFRLNHWQAGTRLVWAVVRVLRAFPMPGNNVIVIVEVLNQFLDCFAEFKEPLLVQNTPLPILMRERQAGNCNLAIILAKRICLQILLGVVNGLIRISSEHALIEALRWRESRRIGQKNVEKFEALGVAGQDNETDRERHGHDQADRAP